MICTGGGRVDGEISDYALIEQMHEMYKSNLQSSLLCIHMLITHIITTHTHTHTHTHPHTYTYTYT